MCVQKNMKVFTKIFNYLALLGESVLKLGIFCGAEYLPYFQPLAEIHLRVPSPRVNHRAFPMAKPAAEFASQLRLSATTTNHWAFSKNKHRARQTLLSAKKMIWKCLAPKGQRQSCSLQLEYRCPLLSENKK